MVLADDLSGFDREPNRSRRSQFLGMPFDQVSFAHVLDELRASGTDQPARYVVTPNADHVVKLSRNSKLAFIYDDAWLSLCDSKPVWAMSRYLNGGLDHVTGSDLTAHIFKSVLRARDPVALVVANQELADAMILNYPDLRFRIHVPPARLADQRDAFEACVDFLAAEPARFAFVAIGAPQSERIAHAWSRRPGTTGTALCVGASLEFIVGLKTRAPRWMRAAGLEWLHRLMSEPRRLWRRYTLAVVPLFQLLVGQIRRSRMKRI
jgi:N-acetylglucosaminyldiphosphoundecaprenol N-acetyl-beta-D-mannosaminyltransferase